jgi:hypothetical protein
MTTFNINNKKKIFNDFFKIRYPILILEYLKFIIFFALLGLMPYIQITKTK